MTDIYGYAADDGWEPVAGARVTLELGGVVNGVWSPATIYDSGSGMDALQSAHATADNTGKWTFVGLKPNANGTTYRLTLPNYQRYLLTVTTQGSPTHYRTFVVDTPPTFTPPVTYATSDALATETTRAAAAESSNATAISAEATARANADATLTAAAAAAQATANAAATSTALAAEATTARAAESAALNATNVLSLGVKGNVLTVTDAAITASTALLSSAAAAFTSANVGQYVHVVGAGTAWNARGAWAATTAYVFGDAVTYNGLTYIAGASFTSEAAFTCNSWMTSPSSTAQTLMAKILSVSGGVATLDTNASTTVSGATCVYGTDDSPIITALGAGDYYFPGGRTYFLADWFMASNTSARFGDGAIFKVPAYTSTDVAPFRLLTSNRQFATYVSGIHLDGTLTIDMTELTPPNGTQPRGLHILNATDWSVKHVVGIGIPGVTGNVVNVGGNQGNAAAQRGSIRSITARNVRGIGSSAVQHTGGFDIDYATLVTDGGVAFRCEMDGNTTTTSNIRVGVAHHLPGGLFPNSAAYLVAHGNAISGIKIGVVRAEGTADGLSLSYQTNGSVTDCTVERITVTGGGRGVSIGATNQSFPGVVIKDVHVDGAYLVPVKSTGGTLPGVGCSIAPGMTFRSIAATNCAANGVQDISQTSIATGSAVRIFDLTATGNAGAGLAVANTENVSVFGGKLSNTAAYPSTVTQLLTPAEILGTVAGSAWIAGSGTSSLAGGSGTLTATASGTGTFALARTPNGVSGFPAVPGQSYTASASVTRGTAPSGATAQISFFWFNAAGAATTTDPSPSGSTPAAVTTGATAITFTDTAPPDAAYGTMTLKFYSNVGGGTLTSGWTMLYASLSVLLGNPSTTQNYGVNVGSGCTVDLYGVDTRSNATSATTGAGTVNALTAADVPAAITTAETFATAAIATQHTADVAAFAPATGTAPGLTAGNVTTNANLTGDVTSVGNATTLAASGVTAASYGDATHTTAVTFDAKGRATTAASTAIAIPESAVTNLVTDLAAKAPLASPALTGTPTVPTATAGTSTTQAASTAFVAAAIPKNYLAPTGADYETYPRQCNYEGQQFTLTGGVLSMFAIQLPANYVVGHITFYSAATAANLPTHWWFGLYDSSRVQLATTADQTTAAWAANTKKTLAVATIAAGASATFTTTYSGLHYLGIVMTGTGMITMPGTVMGTAVSADPPIMCGISDTAQTTPPAFAHTANAITANANLVYGWVGA